MVDEKRAPATFGIRTVTAEFLTALDQRFVTMRKGTRYENVRQFDSRVFVAVTREGLTESEIARAFSVSRQAVHASVGRLMQLKLLERQAIPGNRRDKHIVLTARGKHANEAAAQQIAAVEAECAAVIGTENFKTLRLHLELIAKVMKQKADTKLPE